MIVSVKLANVSTTNELVGVSCSANKYLPLDVFGVCCGPEFYTPSSFFDLPKHRNKPTLQKSCMAAWE